MIAKCPTCEAKYKVADAKVSPGGTKFKCKKCKATFTVYRETRERSREPERRTLAMKNCPHCGKPIPVQAVKCRWCREAVGGAAAAAGGGGFEEQGGPEGGHQDPFAPQGPIEGEHQDPFATQGGPEGEHQDPFATQGGGGPEGANLFAEEDGGFGGGAPGYGGPPSPGGYPGAGYPGATATFEMPITGKKINPGMFVYTVWPGAMLFLLGEIIAGTGSAGFGAVFLLLGLPLLIYALVYSAVALYRCWWVAQSPDARTTPGKAIAFMFIPFFNLYWVFVAVKGLADDANAFLMRAGIGEEKISPGLSLAFCICYIVAGFFPLLHLATFILLTILIYQWADFTNGVLDAPGKFADNIPAGYVRKSDNTVLMVLVGVLGGLAVLGILAAILIPAFIAARGY